MYSIKKPLKIAAMATAAMAVRNAFSTVRSPAFCSETSVLNLPTYGSISPSSLEASVNNELASFKTEVSKLNKSVSHLSKDETVNALENVSSPLTKQWSVVNHLLGVKNSDPLREVHKSLQVEVVKSFQGL
jgi:Zn-dependent oligopeptidase